MALGGGTWQFQNNFQLYYKIAVFMGISEAA